MRKQIDQVDLGNGKFKNSRDKQSDYKSMYISLLLLCVVVCIVVYCGVLLCIVIYCYLPTSRGEGYTAHS